MPPMAFTTTVAGVGLELHLARYVGDRIEREARGVQRRLSHPTPYTLHRCLQPDQTMLDRNKEEEESPGQTRGRSDRA